MLKAFLTGKILIPIALAGDDPFSTGTLEISGQPELSGF
jgi:hypothetical protein